MFCTSCGTQFPDGTATCPACGAPAVNLMMDANALQPDAAPEAASAEAVADAPVNPADASAAPADAPVNPADAPAAPADAPVNAAEGPVDAPADAPVNPADAPVDPNMQGQPAQRDPNQPEQYQPVQPEQNQPDQPEKKKKGGLIALIIGAVVLAAALVIAILAISNGTKTVSLDKYVTVEFSGYDGYGHAKYDLDTEAFLADWSGKINVKKNAIKRLLKTEFAKDRELTEAEAAETVAVFNTMEDTSRAVLGVAWDCMDQSKYSGFSNGDEVSLTWHFDEDDMEALEAILGVTLKATDRTDTVEGLSSIASFNPFNSLEITFTGYNGYGRASFDVKNSGFTGLPTTLVDEMKSVFRYDITMSASSGLSNGDEITLTFNRDADIWGDDGVVISPTSTTVKVSGLTELVEVNPFDAVSLSYSGYSGEGSVNVSYDFSKISGLTNAQQSALADLGYYDSLNKSSSISNGDQITLTFDCAADQFASSYGIVLTELTKTFTVEGMKEYVVYNPLDAIKVVFEGTSPNGSAKIYYKSLDEIEGDYTDAQKAWMISGDNISYSLNQNSGLANGDKVVVTYEPASSGWFSEPEPMDEYAKDYGLVTDKDETSKTFEVSGLAYYMNDLSQLPADTLEKIKKECQDKSTASATNWNAALTYKGMEYVGMYIKTPKDYKVGESGVKYNRLYFLFKASGTHTEQKKDFTFYRVYRIEDVVINADGTVFIDLSNLEVLSGKVYVDNDTGVISTDSGWHSTSIDGYLSLDSFVSNVIAPQVDTYEYATDIK